LPKKLLRFVFVSDDPEPGMSRRGPLAGGAFAGLLALLDGILVVDLAGVVIGVCVCGWLLAGTVWLETPDVTVGCDALPVFIGDTSRDTWRFS